MIESFPAIRSVGNRLRAVGVVFVAFVLYLVAWTVAGCIVGFLMVLRGLAEGGGEDLDASLLWIMLGVIGLAGVIGLIRALVRFPTRRRALEQLIMTESGAVIVDGEDHPQIRNLLDGLAIAAGTRRPRFAIVDDPAPNAFGIGSSPTNTIIGITTGLLATLTRPQLEAILAWQVVRISSFDIGLATWTTALTGDALAALKDVDGVSGALSRGFLFGPKRMSARLQAGTLRRAARRRDRLAVGYTRNPIALLEAFVILRRDGNELRTVSRTTAPLWIEVPQQAFAGSSREERLGRALGLDDRIAALAHIVGRPVPPTP